MQIFFASARPSAGNSRGEARFARKIGLGCTMERLNASPLLSFLPWIQLGGHSFQLFKLCTAPLCP
jgi:hypothetical protein